MIRPASPGNLKGSLASAYAGCVRQSVSFVALIVALANLWQYREDLNARPIASGRTRVQPIVSVRDVDSVHVWTRNAWRQMPLQPILVLRLETQGQSNNRYGTIETSIGFRSVNQALRLENGMLHVRNDQSQPNDIIIRWETFFIRSNSVEMRLVSLEDQRIPMFTDYDLTARDNDRLSSDHQSEIWIIQGQDSVTPGRQW